MNVVHSQLKTQVEMNSKKLRILSWNANGNCNHISDKLALYTRISDLEIDVISLNEVHQRNFCLPGYQTIDVSSV